MKKKLFFIIAAFAMTALIITACGGNSNSGEPKDTQQPVKEADPGGETKEITITAKNFQFDQQEIKVKKGDKIKLTLKNASGGHGIEIPDLGVKQNGDGTVEFTADKAGTFDYNCSVMCGTGHDRMTGKLFVE